MFTLVAINNSKWKTFSAREGSVCRNGRLRKFRHVDPCIHLIKNACPEEFCRGVRIPEQGSACSGMRGQDKTEFAIDTLNYGIDNYNLYITHKNRQFRNPKLEDSRVKELIDNADNGVFTANEIFYGLFSSNKELNDLITDARNRMPDLISDLDTRKRFR